MRRWLMPFMLVVAFLWYNLFAVVLKPILPLHCLWIWKFTCLPVQTNWSSRVIVSKSKSPSQFERVLWRLIANWKCIIWLGVHFLCVTCNFSNETLKPLCIRQLLRAVAERDSKFCLHESLCSVLAKCKHYNTELSNNLNPKAVSFLDWWSIFLVVSTQKGTFLL